MFKKLEEFLFNKLAGKLIARAAVTAAAYLAGPMVNMIAAKTGVHITLDAGELEASMIMGAHAAFEMFKAWRSKSSAPKAEPAAAAPEPPKA